MTDPILTAISGTGHQLRCVICGHTETSAVAYRLRDNPAGLMLLACPSCGSLQFEPPPDLDYHHHTDDRRQIEAYVENNAGIDRELLAGAFRQK